MLTGWMLKSQLVAVFTMNNDSKPPDEEWSLIVSLSFPLPSFTDNLPIVHHPSSIPVHVPWLESQRLIHASDHDGRATVQELVRGFKAPKAPTEARVAIGQI